MFAGTPEFALASLEALVADGMSPIAVLTQPDRPAGRGKKLTASPVKKYAISAGIPVLQPTTLRDESVVAELAALKPDVMIVAAYGLILPQDVLDLPTQACLNVHASLLPRWRGAAPVQAAILNADKTTGISLMSMTAGLDCGPVFLTAAIDIAREETAGELHDRLATLGGQLLSDNLDAILTGRLVAVDQDESLASYAAKIRTADARLDWSLSAEEIGRRVRAYNPAPGAWFMLGDERVKCWRATVADSAFAATGAAAGTFLSADHDGIVVACGRGAIVLTKLQRPGRRSVTAQEFAATTELRGRNLA
jgi:methionyl-tRNA formyltransferase